MDLKDQTARKTSLFLKIYILDEARKATVFWYFKSKRINFQCKICICINFLTEFLQVCLVSRVGFPKWVYEEGQKGTSMLNSPNGRDQNAGICGVQHEMI